jgi:magnesium-transporting ATPase (P-type)
MPTIGPNIPDNDANRLHHVYDAVSKNIERENALINFRIVWAILLSAGIVGTETFIITFVKENYGDQHSVKIAAQLIVLVLSVIATIFCVLSTSGVWAAQAQMKEVKKSYYAHETDFSSLGLPRPFGDKVSHKTGNYNAAVFPLALCVLWIVLSLMQIWRLNAISLMAPPVQAESPKDIDIKKSLTDISNSLGSLGQKIDTLLPKKPK